MTLSTHDAPLAISIVTIGRPYQDWLTEFIAHHPEKNLSERKIIEGLLRGFRAASEKEQEELMQGPRRPFDRIGEVIEVLPASKSVFR